jgi:RND family efflux transporter MFP subunit
MNNSALSLSKTHRLLRCLAAWLLAIAASMSLVACGQDRTRTEAAPRPAYVATVRNAGDAALPFVGDVRATRRSELSFAVSGMVVSVQVEPGDSVRKGQVLANLDSQPLRAQLAAATADVQRAQANFNEARDRVERMQPAQEVNAVSATEWGAVQLELANTLAALNSAQAQREHAAWQLEHSQLRSPINGVIAERFLEAGQAVGPGAPVLSIDGVGRELVISVPNNMTPTVGQTVTLRCDGKTVASQVLRVAGRLEAGGVRRVWLAAPKDDSPGSTWSASMHSPTTATTTPIMQVPLRSIAHGAVANVGSALRLANDGQTLELVTVKLGAVRNDWIDVHEGLAFGDRVVIAGAQALQSGMKVTPVAAQ